MRNKILITFIFILFTGLAVNSCDEAGSQNSKEEKLKELESKKADLEKEIAELRSSIGEKKDPIPVEAERIGLSPFSHFLSLYGTVESDKDINLSPKTMGLVLDVKVNEGQKVNKGQVLAQLDDQMVRKRLKEAKDSYDFIKTTYEKQKRVWEKKVGSEIEYLRAKNNKENMENKIDILEEELDNMKIKAPFSGVVNKVLIKEGEMASPNFPAFHIVSESDLKVRADVSESMSNVISEGDKARIYFPDLKLDTLDLKVSAISSSINRENRTVSVYINLPKSVYGKVKPAMLAVTKFKTAEKDSTMIIPTNLIQKEGTTEFVYVESESKDGSTIADKKIIKTGKSFGGRTEIIGGVTPDDKLITVGYEKLREGDKINIKQSK